MFGRKIEKDPKKALDNADKMMNKGLSGALVKGFMGKDYVDQMNQAMDKGREAINNAEQAQALTQSGADASAEVLAIEDTGTMINYNPVVKLTLRVQPAYGAGFQTMGQSVVSKIAIPRVGDTIKIKFNPADPSQIVVVS